MKLAGEEFDDIVVKYMPLIIKYCYSIIGSYHDAEEVAVNSLTKLYYSMDRIEHMQQMKAYLYKIAYTGCIDELRKKKRDKNLVSKYTENMDEESFVCSGFEPAVISENLAFALESLKACDRALVYGIAVEEKNFKEMSYILGKSESTLRKRYERAREKLKRILSESEVAIIE